MYFVSRKARFWIIGFFNYLYKLTLFNNGKEMQDLHNVFEDKFQRQIQFNFSSM